MACQKKICIILALLVITIDSVMKMNKKKLSASLFRRAKIKKIQTSRFINAKLESDSDSEPNSEAESGYNTAH